MRIFFGNFRILILISGFLSLKSELQKSKSHVALIQHTSILFSMPEKDLVCPITWYGKGRIPKIPGCYTTSGCYSAEQSSSQDAWHRLTLRQSMDGTPGVLISEITCSVPNRMHAAVAAVLTKSKKENSVR